MQILPIGQAENHITLSNQYQDDLIGRHEGIRIAKKFSEYAD